MEDYRPADHCEACRCMCTGVCLPGVGGRRWAAGRTLLSRTSIPASRLRRGIHFVEQRKLKRISHCAKYLYVDKLAAGFLRKVKGNTNCITIATNSASAFSLSYTTPQHSNPVCFLYKQVWASSWSNNHAFLSLLFCYNLGRLSFMFNIKTSPLNKS